VEWVRKWAILKERLVEIAKVLRRFPWMVDVIRQTPKAFCARDGAVKETRLELVFNRYEVYEGEMREVYRPKGLLVFTTAAKEYVRLLIPAL
jgi:hypothetical protein